jgi:hypothetical protein
MQITRRTASVAVMVVGAILLLIVPLLLVALAFGGTRRADLPGTLVILSATAGMALIAVGAALRD